MALALLFLLSSTIPNFTILHNSKQKVRLGELNRRQSTNYKEALCHYPSFALILLCMRASKGEQLPQSAQVTGKNQRMGHNVILENRRKELLTRKVTKYFFLYKPGNQVSCLYDTEELAYQASLNNYGKVAERVFGGITSVTYDEPI